MLRSSGAGQGGALPQCYVPYGCLHWATIVAHFVCWSLSRPTLTYPEEQSVIKTTNSMMAGVVPDGFPRAMRSLRVSSKISARIQRAVSETGKEKYCMASGETLPLKTTSLSSSSTTLYSWSAKRMLSWKTPMARSRFSPFQLCSSSSTLDAKQYLLQPTSVIILSMNGKFNRISERIFNIARRTASIMYSGCSHPIGMG